MVFPIVNTNGMMDSEDLSRIIGQSVVVAFGEMTFPSLSTGTA